MQLAARVLAFWFGDDEEAYRDVWFEKNSEFDTRIDVEFGKEREIAATGGHDDLAATPEGALALVILLDQFSRNLLRGSAEAFASDPKALGIAKTAIARGFDKNVSAIQRMFFYLPFEHSEDLSVQEEGVALFTALGDEKLLEYMINHRDIVARFGRFPHRNDVLGRESTPEEIEFLKTFESF